MSITKRNTLICDECGLFCKYYDEYTYYGCSNPEDPEPYDPCHICKKCFPEVKAKWVKRFKEGYRCGDWAKSRAETEAAKECGLVFIYSTGVGTLGTKDFSPNHQYITQEEYDRLDKLPYWGYCKKCGAVRKGGYCSKKTCDKSFNYGREPL